MVFQTLQYRFEIVEGHIVRITHICAGDRIQYWDIYLENVFWGGKITFPMSVDGEAVDRILWMYDLTQEEFQATGEYKAKGYTLAKGLALGDDLDPAESKTMGVVAVYSNKQRDKLNFILLTNRQQMYKRFVHFRHKWERVSLFGNSFRLRFWGRLYSEKHLDIPQIGSAKLVIDQNHFRMLRFPFGKTKKGRFWIGRFRIPLESIVSQETMINNPIHIEVAVGDERLEFNIGHKTKRKRPTKYNYIPIKSKYYRDKALFVRGNVNQNWTLVVRDKDPIEHAPQFLLKESPYVSAVLYHLGRIVKKLHRANVNLYFEKNSIKADEGTFEIFQRALGSRNSKNYFILDSRSESWEKLSGNANVIEKYSWKYYWLLYTADNFISTETSSHLNVHRAVNYYVRKALLKPKLIFLQHGVTYMKKQGEGSVFGKGKEGEPAYIMVDSPKEAKVVAKMLKIPIERCVDTGLPVFSTIEYGHIRQETPDVATIMLTWKPSEEHMISHFEDSTYYRYTRKIYDILLHYLPEGQIRIVPHPKVLELLLHTDLSDVIWTGTVAEVLRQTKLLLTDYSSVCYNAFYQGAAVIFYQEDLEAYEREVGKLIPAEDEYIGYRFFETGQLDVCLQGGIINGEIMLEVLRTEEFRQRYSEINRHCDGKNVERIVEFLHREKVI